MLPPELGSQTIQWSKGLASRCRLRCRSLCASCMTACSARLQCGSGSGGDKSHNFRLCCRYYSKTHQGYVDCVVEYVDEKTGDVEASVRMSTAIISMHSVHPSLRVGLQARLPYVTRRAATEAQMPSWHAQAILSSGCA
eukprot:6017174-Amphidinium_carterae.4